MVRAYNRKVAPGKNNCGWLMLSRGLGGAQAQAIREVTP